jgi:phage shock protein A
LYEKVKQGNDEQKA